MLTGEETSKTVHQDVQHDEIRNQAVPRECWAPAMATAETEERRRARLPRETRFSAHKETRSIRSGYPSECKCKANTSLLESS